MSKHTPGPWESSGCWAGYAIRTHSPENRIAIVDQNNGLPHEVNEANARLMAAAPDLLAACQSWVDHLSKTFPPYAPGESPSDKMRAVIAKATNQPKGDRS